MRLYLFTIMAFTKLFGMILLISFFLSCTTDNRHSSGNEIQILENNLKISHGDLILARMSPKKVIAQDSLLIFDQQSSQFVIFDLQKKRPVWSLTLSKDGPNFLELPVLDTWFEEERLYVLSRLFFSVYDANNGNIITRLSAEEIKGWNDHYLLTSFVYQSDESILFAKHNRALRTPNAGIDDPTYSIVYKYSLKTNRLDSLNINNPPETLAYDPLQGYYTNYSKPYLQPIGDNLVFSFEFGSNIYEYNNLENSVQSIAAPSKYSSPFREPENPDIYRNSRAQYIYSGPKYFSILPLGDTGLFARAHGDWLKTTEGNNVRLRYLTILDSNFQVMKEVEINERVWDHPFVMGNKVFFVTLDRELEDHFEFITYEVSKN